MLGINVGDSCTSEPFSPKEVSDALFKTRSARLARFESLKFFHCDPSRILPILRSTKMRRVFVQVPNPELETLNTWNEWKKYVEENVRPISRTGATVFLCVGNEVLAPWNSKYAGLLLERMTTARNALKNARLDVKVVTPLDMTMISESYPPSSGCVKPELRDTVRDIIKFLKSEKSPFCINIYPFLARGHVSEAFALFGGDSGYLDRGRRYRDLFSAQYDSVVVAVEKLGGKSMEIVVTETGWPTSNAREATSRNMISYIKGVKRISGTGTPRRKGPLDIFVFELYDEESKGGEAYERHFGVFRSDRTLKN